MPRSWFDRFVALDVEISQRSPLAVCAIAAVRYEAGQEVNHYHSLVSVVGRVRYTEIHGLSRADLHDAPAWRLVWSRVASVIDDIDTVVAYRAAFDRAAVMTMCARHAVRIPRVRFVCAAAMYQRRFGPSVTLATALRTLEVAFPGRPHDPLADARAAAALILKLRERLGEGDTIQLSQNPTPGPAMAAGGPTTPR